MDAENCKLACGLVSRAYIDQGSQALAKRHRLVKALLSQRRLPADGWDDATIEMFIQDASMMDSNNFVDNIGVGEREARVACGLVARRHYGLAHGIGRSGDVAAEQPKAGGSSLLAKLTNLLAADALRLAGLADLGAVTVLPLATGMALTTTLLALRLRLPPTARYVIWPRIDQKTCLKAIVSANLEVVVVENLVEGDELRTDVAAIAAHIERLGPENVACIITTTSCFAPRGADCVVEVAKLCAENNVPHIINNAYGIQSRALCSLVTAAWRKGRVDAVIQSTDKNFMVPVGGSLVVASRANDSLVRAVNQVYPGRASMAPLLDLLMTLLHWGAAGWIKVLREREELYPILREKLIAFATSHGERVLSTPNNPISLGLTLDSLTGPARQRTVSNEPGAELSGSLDSLAVGSESREASNLASDPASATYFGSMLFNRCISGTRVVARGKAQTVGGVHFQDYGAHVNGYHSTYMTVAAALGTSEADIDHFLLKLDKCFKDFAIQRKSAQ